MEIVASLEALAIMVVVVAFLRHITVLERANAAERSELATRIQHPNRIVRGGSEPVEVPDREPDEWAQVGQIAVTREWLEADD